MFTIFEHRKLEKQFNKIPKEIIKRYELWKMILEFQGLKGLKATKGFHDESLKGKWSGYRSSRLNKQWRVIYKANQKSFEVYVIEITPHNY